MEYISRMKKDSLAIFIARKAVNLALVMFGLTLIGAIVGCLCYGFSAGYF